MIAAVVLSCLAIGSCEFVTRDGPDGQATFGLLTFSAPDENLGWLDCASLYSDQNGYSASWLHEWAAISSVIAASCGFILVLFMLLDCCCNVCCSKYMQTFLVICCQLNQGFTFLLWLSDACFNRKTPNDSVVNRGCRVGNGSIYSFTAFMLFFIGGFFLFCSPKPDPLCCNNGYDKGCCDSKDEKKKSAEDDKPIANEEKPIQEDKAVVAAAAVVPPPEEKEDEEEKVEELPAEEEKEPETDVVPVVAAKDIEEGVVDDNIDEEPPTVEEPVADKEPPLDEEAPPPVTLGSGESFEVEFDEGFGSSLNKGWIE